VDALADPLEQVLEEVIGEVDGVVAEYALAAHRYLGAAAAAAYLAQIDQPGTRIARIAVRPTWAGLLDFQTRLPAGFTQ
jgi:hypothetical protein